VGYLPLVAFAPVCYALLISPWPTFAFVLVLRFRSSMSMFISPFSCANFSYSYLCGRASHSLRPSVIAPYLSRLSFAYLYLYFFAPSPVRERGRGSTHILLILSLGLPAARLGSVQACKHTYLHFPSCIGSTISLACCTVLRLPYPFTYNVSQLIATLS
jgi:hypothetical protein